jgi:hypothetical protein
MAARIAFALVGTTLWIAVAVLHVRELLPSPETLKLDQLAGLLADQSAELALFWLVLGYIWLVTAYFQQRTALRDTAKLARQTAEQTQAVSARVEAESRRFQEYQKERVRAAQPVWEIQGCIAHKEQHEINMRNAGAAASSIRATWDRDLPLVVALSNPNLIDRGEQLTLKVMFKEAPLDNFGVTLEYRDALQETRKARIEVSDAAVAVCQPTVEVSTAA